MGTACSNSGIKLMWMTGPTIFRICSVSLASLNCKGARARAVGDGSPGAVGDGPEGRASSRGCSMSLWMTGMVVNRLLPNLCAKHCRKVSAPYKYTVMLADAAI